MLTGIRNITETKIKIIQDTDIYFSKDKNANLIIVGGTSNNKVTLDLNKNLIIRHIKIKSHSDNKYYDYLINRMDYNSIWIGYKDIEEYGSIQIIKNPYNTNKTNPTYIIIIFGINRKGTIAAGCRLMELWKDILMN